MNKCMKNELRRQPLNIIFSAPSGVGKSTIINSILTQLSDNLIFSTSVTSRAKRINEIDGSHYNFVSYEQFQKLIDNDQLIEYAEIYGNYYGTSLLNIQQHLANNFSIIFDINWQGAQKIKQHYPNNTISIFILPPSIDALINRIKTRATDSPEVIKQRIAKAKDDLIHCHEYDYVIINDQLQVAVKQAINIIEAAKLQVKHTLNITEYIQNNILTTSN